MKKIRLHSIAVALLLLPALTSCRKRNNVLSQSPAFTVYTGSAVQNSFSVIALSDTHAASVFHTFPGDMGKWVLLFLGGFTFLFLPSVWDLWTGLYLIFPLLAWGIVPSFESCSTGLTGWWLFLSLKMSNYLPCKVPKSLPMKNRYLERHNGSLR